MSRAQVFEFVPRLGGLARRANRRAWGAALLRQFGTWSAMEAQRFILFAPCLMMAGILLAFLGEPVPPVLPGAVVAASASVWGLAARASRDRLRLFLRSLTIVLLGFFLMSARFAATEQPMLAGELGAVTVTGQLTEVELREADRRYTIRVESIRGLPASELPRKVRVVWRGEAGEEKAGDRVSLRAHLGRPPGPALPGGYNFARQMRFEGIGGTGFAYAPPTILETGGVSFRHRTERLRERVADRVEASIGGAEGAVAAALMTGKRERIPETAVEALRDAGLAHLLAISGLHMGLVCGFLFFALRRLLAEWEWLALRVPIKKWAAAGALLGGTFYLLLSGAAWSAQRAFIMAAIVFLAMIFDRRGISLRNAALAAMVILILRPEAVLAPGFQMSFAAVIVLVSAFEAIEKRWPREKTRGPFGKASRFISGLTLTSLLAGMATGPFAAFHFGRVASYGLLGNMLAMPIITLAVMPVMVLSMFLMPLGLDGPVLFLVGQGIGLVLDIAQWTSSLPGSVGHVPQLHPTMILLASSGLLVLALLRAPWRMAGGVLLLAALPAGFLHQQPEVFLSRDLRNVGVRQNEGAPLSVLSTRRDRFSVEAWLQALGREQDVAGLEVFEGCSSGACTAPLRGGGWLAVTESRADLSRLCAEASVVILRARLGPDDQESCGAVLLGLDDAGTHPAAALRQSRGRWLVERAAE